jgi:hypothetical protein
MRRRDDAVLFSQQGPEPRHAADGHTAAYEYESLDIMSLIDRCC